LPHRLGRRYTRTFYLHYTRQADGKRVRMKLGRFPEIRLGKAREKARAARGEIGQGNDPVADKRAQAASLAVSDLVENYIARHAAAKRSGDEIARRLRKNVKDVIGPVKLSDLHRRDITRCLDAVKDRGAPVEANRLFEDIRAMVRWARGRGDLDTNIVEGMRRPTETAERNRVLSADEIRTMWAALADTGMREATRRIVRLCLVTGQRVGEIAGMTRDEIDLDNSTWIIPATRSKNKHEHPVPLSGLALVIIREQIGALEALAERKGRAIPRFVFPGPGARAAVVGAAVAKGREARTTGGQGRDRDHGYRAMDTARSEKIGSNPHGADRRFALHRWARPEPPQRDAGDCHQPHLRPLRLRKGEARGAGSMGRSAGRYSHGVQRGAAARVTC
jgi:integrase